MKRAEFYNSTAWKWFSKYMLLLHADKNHMVRCATSNRYMYIADKKCHLGHLIKVFESGANTNFSVAFNEKNVMPQHHQENVFMGGNELKMMDSINNKYGSETYNELRIKSKFSLKLGKVELKIISDEYRFKFNQLAKIKGNPWKKKKLLNRKTKS